MKPSHISSATLLPPIWEQNYNVSRLLSIYTHDIIYELIEQISNKKYILKILDKKYFHEKLYQTLSSSDCSLLLLPIEVTEDSHFMYFIYEYYPCLTDLLLIREFSYGELSVLIQDIGNAILFLHKNHITHRDIAPGNIFMKENGHFLLGDFSSALFEENIFSSNSSIMTSISCKIKNFGYYRTGNTPFFSPHNCTNRQNGYYFDTYGFAMLLFLLLNEFEPPTEEDFAKSSPSSILEDIATQKSILSVIKNNNFTTNTRTSTPYEQQAIDSKNVTKELLLAVLTESNPKESPNFQTLFYQLTDIFQNTATENLTFHTAIIKKENTNLFLRTASLNARDSKLQHCKTADASKSTVPTAHKKLTSTQNHSKPKLPIFLYGFLFLSILLFSISFYRSLISRQQRQTNITQSVLSEQDKRIFMNKQNLTSVDFLQENHSVEILVLSENKIGSVKPLAELTQLLILDLSCNQQLIDILSLTNLQNLQQLVLTDTNITEEEHAVLQKALPDCTILY